MSNASRCRALAARYAKLAESTANGEVRCGYRKLESLWLEIMPLAERFDRRPDDGAKQRIYEIMQRVEQARHQMA